ncbi:PTS system protein [Parelusimicrobium proximum]|uniref:PTS sugar transporter subunit IIC n=1 Tax=Parelusimicrobium proximum TaxID=3228953 RepID=UPI003D16B02B
MISVVLILIAFSFLAAVFELDDTLVAQLGISSPLVAGGIFGVLMGRPAEGIQMGAFMSILLIDYAPLGGILAPNGLVGAFSSVMILNLTDIPVYFAFFFGLIAAFAYRYVEFYTRGITAQHFPAFREGVSQLGEKVVYSFLCESLLRHFLITFAFLAFIALAALGFRTPNQFLFEHLDLSFKLAYFGVPWIGAMALLKKFTFKVR